MEVKTITYQRVKNLGNYQSERIEMIAELSADDDVDQCAAELKDKVENALGLNQSQPEPKPEPKPAPKPAPAKVNYDNEPF